MAPFTWGIASASDRPVYHCQDSSGAVFSGQLCGSINVSFLCENFFVVSGVVSRISVCSKETPPSSRNLVASGLCVPRDGSAHRLGTAVRS